jgi:hypothetical protein
VINAAKAYRSNVSTPVIDKTNPQEAVTNFIEVAKKLVIILSLFDFLVHTLLTLSFVLTECHRHTRPVGIRL